MIALNRLFFSEYGEGSGNNKYLEIYNNTGQTVNLDDVVILGNYNGNPWSETFTFEPGAVIENENVYLIAGNQSLTNISYRTLTRSTLTPTHGML